MIGWLVAVSGMLALTYGIAAGQQEDPGAPSVLSARRVAEDSTGDPALDPLPAPVSNPARDSIIVAATATADVQLDGRLDDVVWAAADSIYIFRQREPRSGAIASERTVVRVARDRDALYIAVRAWDSRPAAIRATQLRRDADLGSDDNVTILIDSFHDRRSGFLFRTNPNGAMWDSQLSGSGDENDDWNGIWEVATSRDGGGWTAEFRIPFRTLRFRSGGSPSFGFNVRRFIRRANEEDLWRSYGRAEGLRQLQNEGVLGGLEGLRRELGIAFLPYALAQAVESEHDLTGARTSASRLTGKVGLDAKLAVSPTLTADVTVNTDFAQVEVDRQVVNLTRFPTFFPEKREFFLESSGIFDLGSHREAQLFYSRRIGLQSGEPVPILAGTRLYGKVGSWTLGALDVRTGDGDDANNAVLRVKHDLLDRSTIGAMLTQRSGPGVDGVERAGGLDMDFPLVVGGYNIEPSFWIAGTRTPWVEGTPVAWHASVDYPNDLVDAHLSLRRVAAGFSPTLGFVSRTGVRTTSGHVSFGPRPSSSFLGIRQFHIKLPLPDWDITASEHGSLARVSDWKSAEFEWRPLGAELESGDRFEINISRNMDAPADSFDIFGDVLVPAGSYWWTRGELVLDASEGRTVSGFGRFSWGGFYDGHRTGVDLSLEWRGNGNVSFGLDYSRDDVHLPGGSFTAVETSGEVEYDFSTRMSLQSFVQYNNDSDRVDFNVRFHWIPVIGDDLYVVWNSGYTTDPDARYRFPHRRSLTRQLNGALVVKAVHRFEM
ncbi:MAG TPA: DUF5916 domain-containing protein [Gemmatimonadaceae bacterium]|nr:DUF5916 domain-containing protein [Gemmatimonadaceae bacterium]